MSLRREKEVRFVDIHVAYNVRIYQCPFVVVFEVFAAYTVSGRYMSVTFSWQRRRLSLGRVFTERPDGRFLAQGVGSLGVPRRKRDGGWLRF